MKINDHVHQIKIEFSVTPVIKRYVYIYVMEGKNLYLIDAGVAGSEKIVEEYLQSIGRDITEINAIFLTHSHPDHIGGAQAIKERANCKIFCPYSERDWITDIDKQYSMRPIPNFYHLVERSVIVNQWIADGDNIALEDGMKLQVINTAGHSKETLSYYLIDQQSLFTSDAIPIVEDIPIYVSYTQSINTLNKLLRLDNVNFYCPAWDTIYTKEKGKQKIEEAIQYLQEINNYVIEELKQMNSVDYTILNKEITPELLQQIVNQVTKKLNKEQLTQNPLFKTSIQSNIMEYIN